MFRNLGTETECSGCDPRHWDCECSGWDPRHQDCECSGWDPRHQDCEYLGRDSRHQDCECLGPQASGLWVFGMDGTPGTGTVSVQDRIPGTRTVIYNESDSCRLFLSELPPLYFAIPFDTTGRKLVYLLCLLGGPTPTGLKAYSGFCVLLC